MMKIYYQLHSCLVLLHHCKSVPDNWVDELAKHYCFTGENYNKFYNAYCEAKKNVKIDVENVSMPQKRLAIQFQRKLTELNDDEINSIQKILKKEK